MRIRITHRAGYGDRFGVHHECGAEWDAPDAIAVKLLNRGLAEPVIETTTVAPKENAAKRTGRAKPRRKT